MRGQRSGRTGVVLTALAVVWAAQLPGARLVAASTAGQAEAPVISSPTPMPADVVPAGQVLLGALVRAEADVVAVELHLDGAPAAAPSWGPAAPDGRRVEALVSVAPGPHTARLTVTDSAGGRAERTWPFTATTATVTRLAGSSRVDTAVAVSGATYPEQASAAAAVLARADAFADALAGVPLAAAVDGPLLLTAPGALVPATAAELRRVLPPGAPVHLLGGPAALGDGVAEAVAALGFAPVRHAGADRYATAAAVATALPPSDGAMLASGTAFPDALAASAAAARDGLPILLAPRDRLPAATAAALAERGARRVTLVGGTGALGEAVADEVAAIAPDTRRVAGPDRFATAVAVADAFFDDPAGVSLASGTAFPDALSGARHAAALGQPVLLTGRSALAPPSATAIGRWQPERLHVYGGIGAVGDRTARAAFAAAVDGPGAPAAALVQPVASTTVSWLPEVEVTADRPLDPAGSTAYVAVDGVEVPGEVAAAAGGGLVVHVDDAALAPRHEVPRQVEVRVLARAADGGAAHRAASLTLLQPDPVFAAAGPVALHLPSRRVELVGFHQSSHDGAQQQAVRRTSTRTLTLASRNRGTGSRTAADVVAAPAASVLAPVSGRVLRAAPYVLYCRHTDERLVIEPDDRPGWEVRVLHVRGLRVAAGDRVVAGETVVADGPRQLPLRSQVDAHSGPQNWPHVHVEVVDPTIPDRPGRGC